MVGLKRILMILNVHPLDKVLEEIRLTLDSIESGHIDVHEFVEHMVEKIKIAQKRVKQMKHTPRCAVVPKFSDGDTSKLKRFIPPTTGFMRMKLVEGYNVSDEEQVQAYPLTDSQSHLVIKAAEHSSNPTQLVLFAVDSYRLHLEEAQFLFKFIAQKADDPTIELARILIRMYSSTEAMRMIKSFIGNDILKHRRLKQRLGSAYNPIVGIYSGYYNLDLSSDIDRICLKKLIEKSVRNVDDRRRRGQWDTSQNGNWSCFRNEYHHHYQKQAMSAAVAGTTTVDPNEERTISPKFFYPIPQFGKVEFDFVNIERPDPHVCRATHEDRVIDCLLLSRLLPEDQIEWAINRLNEMSIGLRRHFLPDGSTYYKIEIGRAKMVSEHLYNAYSGISQRRQARKKAIKREAIKSAPVEKTSKYNHYIVVFLSSC